VLAVVGTLSSKRVSRLDLFNSMKPVVTYNLPCIILNVVHGNVVGRTPGADDDHFLSSIIPRVRILGGMDNLSLEAFLHPRRGHKF